MGRRNETNRLAYKKEVDQKKKNKQAKKQTTLEKKKAILVQWNQKNASAND